MTVDALPKKSAPNLGRLLIWLGIISTLASFLILKVSCTTTQNPPPPPCGPGFDPAKATQFQNWHSTDISDASMLDEGIVFERHYYATVEGKNTWIGRVAILEEAVPSFAQASFGSATALNPAVVVMTYRRQGIGEYMLRDTLSRYPAGTRFKWEQDPSEPSGSYTWKCFLSDFPLNRVNGADGSSFNWFTK